MNNLTERVPRRHDGAPPAERHLRDEFDLHRGRYGFRRANDLQLQDGAALLKLIGQRTSEDQAALLAVAQATAVSFGVCVNYPRYRTLFTMR